MTIRTWLAAGLLSLVVAGAGTVGAGEAVAAGKPVGPTAPGGPCGTVVVANNGEQIARSLVTPDIKYAVSTCGATPLAATVTITEAPGRMSETCPSPTSGPFPVALAANSRITATAPVLRASCGFAGGAAGPVTPGAQNWQDHVLTLALTDNATGAVLSSSSFFWQDAPFTHP